MLEFNAPYKKINSVVFILCENIIFLRLYLLPFRKCISHSSLNDIDILRYSVWDLKFSTRSVTVDIFN